jgi:hypothetical protein
MRYIIFYIFITFSFALAEVTISPINGGYILEVKQESFISEEVTENNETYTIISLPGEEGTTEDIGRPQLPKVTRAIGIPDNADANLEILEEDFVTYEDFLVCPFQPPTTDQEGEDSFVIDKNFYDTAQVYPENRISVSHKAWWREVYLSGVDIVPFLYNPKERRLDFFTYIKIRVTYTGSFIEKTIEPWLAGAYKRFLLNYDYYPFNVEYIDSPGVRYLVITHTDFTQHLVNLVEWYKKKGINTRVISKSVFTDDEIKDSITAEYNRNSPHVLKWVLLVGDIDRIPPHLQGQTIALESWYGDLSGDDWYMEVGIGRFSVANAIQLENVIEKTLKYERTPLLGDWLTKSVLVAHKQDYPNKYSACKRGIYMHTYPYYRFTMDTLMGYFNNIDNSDVAEAINEGRNVVNYRGHGSTQTWDEWSTGTYRTWAISDINNLNNGDMTPIVFNIACDCHTITADCLGEAWIRKYPGGAVASYGASTVSYTKPNNGLDSMLYRCLGDTISITIANPPRTYKAPMWDLGWLMIYGHAYMILKYGSQGKTNAKRYSMLGDPALEVWTGIPATPTVQYQEVVPLGSFTLRITVRKEGTPYKDALVCAWKEEEFYVYGYTDADGYCDLDINAQSVGEFDITVTGHEIYPFEGRCTAGFKASKYATFPNQGRQLVRKPNSSELHQVYIDSIGGVSRVLYSMSTDWGQTWSTPVRIDIGHEPSISLGTIGGRPWIFYRSGSDYYCAAKRPDGNWKIRRVCQSEEKEPEHLVWTVCAPIVHAINFGEQSNPLGDLAYGVLRDNNRIYFVAFDTVETYIRQILDRPDLPVRVRAPSIAITPEDRLHVVWQRGTDGGKIFYREARKVTPEDIRQGVLPDWSYPFNVSYAQGYPTEPAANPSAEAHGDYVYAAWRGPNWEGKLENGDIWRRARNINKPPEEWGNPRNMSETQDNESNYPVMSTNFVTVWQESIADNNWDIWGRFEDDPTAIPFFQSEKTSKYPQITSYTNPKTGEFNCYTIWTEEVQDPLYAVKFGTKSYIPQKSESEYDFSYYKVDIGESVPSPYCSERTGYLRYEPYAIDYGNQKLKYKLPYLNPNYYYDIRAITYQRGNNSWQEQFYIDSVLHSTVNYIPNRPETIWIRIPKSAYENDAKVQQKIGRVIGNWAVVADLRLYQIELIDSSKSSGGIQSVNIASLQRPALSQSYPNPFKSQTIIRYVLPTNSNVSLAIYDISGRLVKSLINQPQESGIYSVNWNGKDGSGKNLAQGIYIYRLKTNNYADTKRMILIR